LRLVKWGSAVSLRGSNPEPLMSALGRLPKADMSNRSKTILYSITNSSPVASSVDRISTRPL
jgi:hypothetical protein